MFEGGRMSCLCCYVEFLFWFSSSYVPYVSGFRLLMYPMFPVFGVLCTLCFRFSSSYFLCSPVSLDCPFLIAPLVFSNVYVFTPQIREAEVNLIPFNTHVHHRSLFCLEKGI